MIDFLGWGSLCLMKIGVPQLTTLLIPNLFYLLKNFSKGVDQITVSTLNFDQTTYGLGLDNNYKKEGTLHHRES